MKLQLVLISAILSFVAAVEAQNQQSSLQGHWTVESMERGGRNPPAELTESLKVTIKGDKLELSDASREEIGAFTLDPTANPHEIDLVFGEGLQGNIERTALGIYELEGDTLKLAWRKDGGPRPKKFASIAGERTSELLILKRAKGD